jgi:hypothetical protein
MPDFVIAAIVLLSIYIIVQMSNSDEEDNE